MFGSLFILVKPSISATKPVRLAASHNLSLIVMIA